MEVGRKRISILKEIIDLILKAIEKFWEITRPKSTQKC